MVTSVELRRDVEDVYGRPLETTDDLFSLGGSSLQAIELVNRFEAQLGHPVDIERLIMAESISELIDELVSAVPESGRTPES